MEQETIFHLNDVSFKAISLSHQSTLASTRILLKLQDNTRFQINEVLVDVAEEEDLLIGNVCQGGIVKMQDGVSQEKNQQKINLLKEDLNEWSIMDTSNVGVIEEQKKVDNLSTTQNLQYFFTSNQGEQLYLENFDLNSEMLLTQVRQITKLHDQIQFLVDQEPLSKNSEKRFTLSDVIQEGSKQIVVLDKRDKKGNNQPIQGSQFLKNFQDLDIYLYPNAEKITQDEQNLSKVIMVVGQTGSGKTTLLNSLVNYHMGIEFTDSFRYIVVEEKTDNQQTQSQTQQIKQYLIRAHRDRPSLIIIDTPGFGDTRGMEQDHILIGQIKSFFDITMVQIHAICFVAPANNVRLTPCQKYIFNEVLKLFGKDIAENFVCMITFCDGGNPPVLKSLQSPDSPFKVVMEVIKEPWYMSFNNSGIYQGVNQDSLSNQRTKMYWDISMESFKKFYNKKMLLLPVKSLNLTKQVLKTRETIKLQILEMNNQNEFIIKCQQSFNDQIIIVENNENQINANQNFDIVVEFPQTTKVQLEQGVYVTNCLICNHTCHPMCAFADDEEKINCAVMDEGKCTICEDKCDWTDHHNMDFRFETVMIKKTERCQEIYRTYTDARGSLTNSQSIIKGLKAELESSQIEFSRIQYKLNKLINLLKTSALQTGFIDSSEDYIDEMIRVHQDQRSQGWQKSIQFLQDQKKFNRLLQEAYENENQSQVRDYEYFLDMKAKQLKPNQVQLSASSISMPIQRQVFNP